jgi:hypothetical protein
MILDYTAKGLVLLYEVKWWSAQAWSLQLECPGSRPLILKKKKNDVSNPRWKVYHSDNWAQPRIFSIQRTRIRAADCELSDITENIEKKGKGEGWIGQI